MKTILANIAAALSAAQLPQLTAARVYNGSVLLGLALIGAGAERAFGAAEALLTVGALVLAFAVFERLLARKGGR